MGDSAWTEDDDAQLAFSQFDEKHPITAAREFFWTLDDANSNQAELRARVTPESLPAWGDFHQAKQWIESLNDFGLGSVARHIEGAPDVRFVKIVEGITSGQFRQGLSEIDSVGYLVLIWRPEHGRWLVHGLDDGSGLERLPRSSPGEAPNVT